MSSSSDELSKNLADLKLNTQVINTSVASSSSNHQFQYPRNTHFGYDWNQSATQAFASTSQVMLNHNDVVRAPNPNIATYLERLNTMTVIMYATTDGGSRMLQELLKMRIPQLTEVIFEKLTTILDLGISCIFPVMINQHGKHVFSKLIENCNEEQLERIVIEVTWNTDLFIRHSLTKYGCCSLVKLIKVLKKSPLVDHVVAKLARQFYRLMTEKYGSYIITECLDQLSEEQNQLLYASAELNCLQLAIHKQGCITLNKFLEKVRGPFRNTLINTICSNVVFLAFDPSGNYVVQKVLDLENPNFSKKIAENLKGKYASLSRQKSGSHLVERCLKSTEVLTVVEDLIKSNQVLSLAEDKFGNYVIQTALKVTYGISSVAYSRLVGCIHPYLEKLQNGYGRNVLNAIFSDKDPESQQDIQE